MTVTLLLGGGCPASARERDATWRDLVTVEDRRRLRGWRDAWTRALPAARAGGGGSAIAADPALFDPDRALGEPVPPPGDYRCRTFKLGSQGRGRPAFVAYPWFRCRVDTDRVFRKLGGSQRPEGVIYPHVTGRAVFLGALALGDERRSMRYGRDRRRDMAGFVERVDDTRWRLVLPYPHFESLLDVIDLTPGSAGAGGASTSAD